jgi:very-short-patch-repair endonuclease
MPKDTSRRLHRALRVRSVELRSQQTPAEQVLWQRLRAGKVGTKFRRQHVIGGFVADFCSLEHRLIIEVDGPVHQGHVERDAERTLMLEWMGFRVLRFTNTLVIHKTEEVLALIAAAVKSPTP